MQRATGWGWAIGVALAAMSGPAMAAEDTADADSAASEPAPAAKNYSHLGQFGLRSSLMGGYRMVFRYDDSPYCVEPDFTEPPDEQQVICGHLGPAMLDLAASFAVLGGIEPFVMARLGLVGEGPTNTQPLRVIAAGARIYTRPKQPIKLFIEPSVGVEFESGTGGARWTYYGNFDPQYKTDVVFRVGVGPQFEFARNVGAYVQVFGMSVGILRYIHATMEFGAGVQVRFP